VVLIVEDDGQGFDEPQVMGAHVNEKNLGLYGMRERAALLGGMLTIESTLGIGTSVFAEIPLERSLAREDTSRE
jgi:signal transduction histidine kinase